MNRGMSSSVLSIITYMLSDGNILYIAVNFDKLNEERNSTASQSTLPSIIDYRSLGIELSGATATVDICAPSSWYCLSSYILPALYSG